MWAWHPSDGRLAAAALALLLASPLAAQERPAAPAPAAPDTSAEAPPVRVAPTAPETAAAPADTLEKSPLGAVLRSAVLPGWGQFYTGSPLKGVAVATAEVSFFALAWREDRRASRALEDFGETGETAAVDRFDRHIRQRDDFVSFGVGALLVSMLDAYISAHLYNIDEKLHVRRAGGGWQVAWRWTGAHPFHRSSRISPRSTTPYVQCWSQSPRFR